MKKLRLTQLLLLGNTNRLIRLIEKSPKWIIQELFSQILFQSESLARSVVSTKENEIEEMSDQIFI
jgi:hypothetical protein